jgi:hypothetical protein
MSRKKKDTGARDTKVVEVKRSPPIWGVKSGNRYVADFLGSDARAKAEAYARERFGQYTVKAKPIPKRALAFAEWQRDHPPKTQA